MPRTIVTVVGDLLEDIVVWTTEPARRGTDNPATIRRARGGSGANVAAAVAAAGVAARFVGRVGDDDAGRDLARDLAADGVDCRLQRGGRTGCVVVLVDADGERTMFPDRGAAAGLTAIDPADVDGTSVLHLPLYGFLDPASARHLAAAATAVRAQGGAISVDLSATSAIDRLSARALGDVLDGIGPAVVFANREEAAAARLSSRRPPPGGCFVVKAGADPASVIVADGATHRVAPPVHGAARDTTGAGDVFAGAFLAAWARGSDPTAACVAGHAAAGRTLGVAGAAGGRREPSESSSERTMWLG